MNELDLFAAAIAIDDPRERDALLERECADRPELRLRLDRLLVEHFRSEPWPDRPGLDPSAAVPATEPGDAGGPVEYERPGVAEPAMDRPDLDRTLARPASQVGEPPGGPEPTGDATMDRTGPGQPRDPSPPGILARDDRGQGEQAGAVIAGKYTLVEVVGEGGMGSVWRAKQTVPVKRFVAVKLIKAGMDSRQVLARFDAERQALALMDHPNIAKVLDGGLHDGRPYFVMELVKGIPITEYCDARRLTPKQRLELFGPVCQAIQHAHQKGIIHRDIKPSNVLVALYDDRPVVKVIDFGVAKATGGTLTEHTIDTGFGGVVGTPQYMSPEQATFNNLDVDTRSDVYALGVLLYELLTGTPPFSRQELEKRGVLEMLRVVREEEPQRPSTKLSTADALPTLSANRSTDPNKLTGLLRNELDWIVMKALEKDRVRRYETANGFAADVQRYLNGDAVQAHPPSTAYRLMKFVRRNKGQVIAASLILFALLAGIAGTTWGLFRAEKARVAETKQRQVAEAKEREANDERIKANDERVKAVAAAEKERQAKEDAVRNLAFAKKGNEILGSVFAGLDPNRNYADLGEFSKAITDNLKQAVKELEGSAIGDPLEVAEMQNTLGLSLLGLGEFELAIEVFAKSRDTRKAKLGPDHPNMLTSMSNLARAYGAAGKRDLALPLFEETLKLRRAKLGPKHLATLTTMNNLAQAYQDAGKRDLALPLFEETLKLMKANLGPEDPETLATMNNLAQAYQNAGKLDLALPLYDETLKIAEAKLGLHHLDTLTSMNNLATAYQDAGKRDLALPLFEKTLKLRKAKLGPEHPDTLLSMNNLAQAYQDAGKRDLALPLFEETLKLRKAKLGPVHPDTLQSMNNLALAYEDAEDAGKRDLALPLLEETLKLAKAKLGLHHPQTLTTMGNLATAYRAAGKNDLALPLLEETLMLMKAKIGGLDHPNTLTTMNNLALAYEDAGKRDLALPLFEETLKLKKAKLGPDHPNTLTSMNNLAGVYWSLQQLDKSVPLFEETLKLREATLGRNHPDTLFTVANLGVNYKDAGRLKEAIPLLEEGYQAAKKHASLRSFGPQLLDAYAKAGENAKFTDLFQQQLTEVRSTLPKDSPQLAGMLAQLGTGLLHQKKWAEAEPLLRECLAIREKTQPDDARTFNTQSMLGGALLGQKKYADAEPLLLKGYEGMKAREKTIPPQGKSLIPEALDRLIELYTAMDKPDEVKKWQAERAKYKDTAPMPMSLIK